MNNVVVLDADDMLKLLSGESVDITCGLPEVKGKNQRPLFLRMEPGMVPQIVFKEGVTKQNFITSQTKEITKK